MIFLKKCLAGEKNGKSKKIKKSVRMNFLLMTKRLKKEIKIIFD